MNQTPQILGPTVFPFEGFQTDKLARQVDRRASLIDTSEEKKVLGWKPGWERFQVKALEVGRVTPSEDQETPVLSSVALCSWLLLSSFPG